jgi:hypothetical protein
MRRERPERPARRDDERESLAPAADLRDTVLALQRTAGNAQVQRMLAVARQPEGTGSPGLEDPDMAGGAIVYKDGKLYWKGFIPGVGSTPEIALDPRDVPKQIQDLFKKDGDKNDRKVFPIPKDGLPKDWIEDICKRNPNSPLCFKVPGKKGPEALEKPVGEFYTFDVLFEHNQPAKGAGGMTSAGASTLDSVITLLELDPTLQVRLVGHASSEGTDRDNLELSKRRARAVKAKLDEKKLGARVMDFVGGADPPGGTRLEFGVWACGESGAAPGEPRPEDRKVAVKFLRNAPVGPGPLNLELKVPAH